MNGFLVSIIGLAWLLIALGVWLGWQLLRQNGRMLLRLEELEKRLDGLEFGEPDDEPERLQPEQPNARSHPGPLPAREGEAPDRAARFGNRSLVGSRTKRDGLKAETLAPVFRLPRVEGSGELSLEDLRGRRVLLVFSDPHCGPCQVLAPELEKFYRSRKNESVTPALSPSDRERGMAVVMVSRGEAKENRAKAKEHGLTFPVVLQQRWEISRLYAIFATPVAYLIDEQGVIMNDVAVGVEAILQLMAEAKKADLKRPRTAALQDAAAAL